MINENGAVAGAIIGMGNRSTRKKPAQVPIILPQIPSGLTWDRTRISVVGSRKLTV
jgi:hypothetical protein